MENEIPEIQIDEQTIELAKKPINKMLDISRKLNLIK